MDEDAAHNKDKKVIKLKVDPVSLLAFINQYAKVQLIRNISFDGFIHSIDPISLSIILSIPKENQFQTILIPGHAIIDIFKLPAIDLKPPHRRLFVSNSEQEISSRRTNLIAWFKWNLLSPSELGDKIVVGSVNVLPPYTVSDIYAENPVIALQIKNIMEKMPQDFVPIK